MKTAVNYEVHKMQLHKPMWVDKVEMWINVPRYVNSSRNTLNARDGHDDSTLLKVNVVVLMESVL